MTNYKVEYEFYSDENGTQHVNDSLGNILAGKERWIYIKNTGEATLLDIVLQSNRSDLEPVEKIKILKPSQLEKAFRWHPDSKLPVSKIEYEINVKLLAAPDW